MTSTQRAPAETAALLSAEELVLHPQVKGISLHVNKGEIVGIGGLEGRKLTAGDTLPIGSCDTAALWQAITAKRLDRRD